MALQGRVLAGRYELGPRLGAGGMAGVYQATDQVLDRTVAVKVLGPPYDQDPDFVDQFRHEARMAAGLGHPNVVAIFDSASEGDLHYIVMEYVQGQTLAELLRRHGRLPPGLAAEVAHRVCLALEAAHERGLVHRDIKPANVMVDQAGLVKVMDFGIAKAAAATTTTMLNSAGQLLGTAPYLSPEQAQGRPVDGRSDLYALGCVLYELLTGTPPFRGHSPLALVAQQVSKPPEPPSHRNSEVGAELDSVVLTALAKQPSQRYQTAEAMGQDLARMVRDRGGPVPLRPAADPAGGPFGSPATPSASATTQAQSSVSVAMANLTEVITTGQRQGTIDQGGEDLLHQAEDVVRAVQEGHADDARKKFEELEHKADELIDEGKISPQAVGAVRQALAQFDSATQRSG